MGHLITLATYVPCPHPSCVVLISELAHLPVGSSLGRYLKSGALPTDFSQLAQPMGSRFSGLRLSRFSPVFAQVYKGNFERILQSITIAKSRGATLRVGPELEIPLVLHHSLRVSPE